MSTHLIRAFGVLAVFFMAFSALAADLKSKDLMIGKGKEASVQQKVTVHYTGWLMNGTKFDSSKDRKRPFQFTLGAREVIPGWDAGVQGMRVGGKRELIIPPEMAYGERGAGDAIPPNSTLRFEIELLDVAPPAYANIGNEELKELMKQGVPVVDIRTPAEWQQTGVVEGAKLLPFVMPDGRINPKFIPDLAKIAGPKDKVVLICRSGNRSHNAAEGLSSRFAYEGIYNVQHGMNLWLRENNPVVKPDMAKAKETCTVC